MKCFTCVVRTYFICFHKAPFVLDCNITYDLTILFSAYYSPVAELPCFKIWTSYQCISYLCNWSIYLTVLPALNMLRVHNWEYGL